MVIKLFVSVDEDHNGGADMCNTFPLLAILKQTSQKHTVIYGKNARVVIFVASNQE
jgi:hypothetical protein